MHGERRKKMENTNEALLDFFAGKALIGLLAADAGTYKKDEDYEAWYADGTEKDLAKKAFKIAQAMIDEKASRHK
jgi:hypothetical protein